MKLKGIYTMSDTTHLNMILKEMYFYLNSPLETIL